MSERTMTQTLVAVSVVTTIATMVTVKMGTAWVWRNFVDAMESAWDDILVDDEYDDDAVGATMYAGDLR